jgi:ubiquinone/menaquinone biosynthesis C-methylase UbiE
MKETNSRSWNSFWENTQKKRFSWCKHRIKNILIKYDFKNKKVLEAGCGTGYFSLYFQNRGAEVYSLDFSLKALEITKRIVVDCTLLQADVRKIPIRDGFFDVIFTDGLLEHFENPEIILEEFKRVLNPNGIIITVVPNKFAFWQLLRPFIMKGIEEHPLTLKQLVKLHKNVGLVPLEYGGVNVVPIRFSPEFLGKRLGMVLYVFTKKSEFK